MIRYMVSAISVFTALSAGDSAQAATCATLTISNPPPSFTTWNPITPAQLTGTFDIQLTRVDKNTDSVRLIFVDNDSSTTLRIAVSGPFYEIANGQTLVAYPQGTTITTASPQSAIVVNFGNNQQPDTKSISGILVRVLAADGSTDYVSGASFSESLKYSVQCIKNGNANGVDNAATPAIPINLTIPNLVSAALAGPATLNFNNFTTDNLTTTVSVKSTGSLNVSVSNLNNASKMALNGNATADNSTIPYTMTFGLQGGSLVPISPTQSLANLPRATVNNAKKYDLKLTLTNGIPSGKLAGSYSDTITLTIAPGA